MIDFGGGAGDEVTQGVGGTVATGAIFIGIDLKDVLGAMWVVLVSDRWSVGAGC